MTEKKKRKKGIKYVLTTLVLWVAQSVASPISHKEAQDLIKMIEREI